MSEVGEVSKDNVMIMVRIIINALPEKQKEVLQTLLSLVDSLTKERSCLSEIVNQAILFGWCAAWPDAVLLFISTWRRNSAKGSSADIRIII